MTEDVSEMVSKRQTVTTIIGTTLATILPAPPPQMSVEIYATRYALGSGVVGTVTGYLINSPVTGLPSGGYAPEGTIAGTIDVITLNPGAPSFDGISPDIITRVPPGFTLAGQAFPSGSIIARITYQYRYGRT